jgi:hypothetical protein
MPRYPLDSQMFARKLLHTIDIKIPSGGLGPRLNAMHEWCNARCPGKWTNMGTGRRQDYKPDTAVFRFADEQDAEAFAAAFRE